MKSRIHARTRESSTHDTACASPRCLQRATIQETELDEVPPVVYDVLRAPGRALDDGPRRFMESRFEHDFSGVRVHTDPQAAESAQAVNARAYTVGRDVVFGAGEYTSHTTEGQRLVAHELTHVVQQQERAPTAKLSDSSEIVETDELESDAEQNASLLAEGFPVSVPTTAAPIGIMRQNRRGTKSPARTAPSARYQGCSPDDRKKIQAALPAAQMRVQRAKFQIAGTVAPASRPGSYDPRVFAVQRAQLLARKIFGGNPVMAQVARTVEMILTSLMSPNLTFVCAPKTDQQCAGRDGYVVNHRPPIHLCQSVLGGSPENRIRNLIHEAAHLAGVGRSNTEQYCPVFDCESSCGGLDTADAWSQFIHCVGGQRADQPAPIQGTPQSTPKRGTK